MRTYMRLVLAGVGLLVGALMTALASQHAAVSVVRGSTTVEANTTYVLLNVHDIVSTPASNAVAEESTLSIVNLCRTTMRVSIIPVTNSSLELNPSEEGIAELRALTDTILLSCSSPVRANVSLQVVFRIHRFLWLSPLSLALFLAGTIATSMGVLLALMGLED
ncbi:MAG: hypothetical protein ABWW70_05065 [Thermoproteota archaeon]